MLPLLQVMLPGVFTVPVAPKALICVALIKDPALALPPFNAMDRLAAVCEIWILFLLVSVHAPAISG